MRRCDARPPMPDGYLVPAWPLLMDENTAAKQVSLALRSR